MVRFFFSWSHALTSENKTVFFCSSNDCAQRTHEHWTNEQMFRFIVIAVVFIFFLSFGFFLLIYIVWKISSLDASNKWINYMFDWLNASQLNGHSNWDVCSVYRKSASNLKLIGQQASGKSMYSPKCGHYCNWNHFECETIARKRG